MHYIIYLSNYIYHLIILTFRGMDIILYGSSIRILTAGVVGGPDTGGNAVADKGDLSLDDKGEILKVGAIYGFEQAVLPSHIGLKDVVVSMLCYVMLRDINSYTILCTINLY